MVAVVVKGLLCIFNGDIGDDPCIIELELLDEGCGCGGGGSTSSIGVLIGFPCCEPEVMPQMLSVMLVQLMILNFDNLIPKKNQKMMMIVLLNFDFSYLFWNSIFIEIGSSC